jgi:UDP-GlcNAc:undecaprenyl-phosphate GlcNAc-1-phosphate transferase
MSSNWMFAVGLGFTVTLVTQTLLSQLSYRWQLVDKPGAHRNHERDTPLVGGIGVYFGLLAGLVFSGLPMTMLLPLILGAGLVVITGTLDDLYDLPSRYRFISQVLAATIVCGWGDVRLIDFGVLWPGGHPILTGEADLAISVFAMVGLMNASNMSDGIDGQCGVLSATALGALVIVATMNRQPELVTLISIIFACALAFLMLNLKVPWRAQARVFLGDAGSMLLGFLLAWCFIVFTQAVPGKTGVTMQPVTALWLVALPLFDTLAVLLRRLLEGRSPFRADRSHYHHLLRAVGLTAGQATAMIAGFAVACAAFGVFVDQYIFTDKPAATGHVLMAFVGGFVVYSVVVGCAYWRLRSAMNPHVLVKPLANLDRVYNGDNIKVLRPRVVVREFYDGSDVAHWRA